MFFQLNCAPVFQELFLSDALGCHDGEEGESGASESGLVVSHQVEEEPLDVDEPAAADGEGVGGGRPELGEEDVHRLLGVEVRLPSDVVLLAVDAADEKHGQVRGLPLEADPQVQELLPATSLQVIFVVI